MVSLEAPLYTIQNCCLHSYEAKWFEIHMNMIPRNDGALILMQQAVRLVFLLHTTRCENISQACSSTCMSVLCHTCEFISFQPCLHLTWLIIKSCGGDFAYKNTYIQGYIDDVFLLKAFNHQYNKKVHNWSLKREKFPLMCTSAVKWASDWLQLRTIRCRSTCNRACLLVRERPAGWLTSPPLVTWQPCGATRSEPQRGSVHSTSH